MLRSSFLRQALSIFKSHQRCTSSIPTPATNSDKVQDEIHEDIQNKIKQGDSNETNLKDEVTLIRSKMVKAAFANLKHNHMKSRNNVDEKIKDAKTVEELLTLSEQSLLTRGQAFQVLPIFFKSINLFRVVC